MPAAPPIAAAQRVPRVSRSIRVVALLILVVIFGVIAHQQLSQRDQVIDDARAELTRFATVFAEQTARAIETVDLILREQVEQLHLPADQRPDFRSLPGERIQSRIGGIHQILRIQITDLAGQVLVTTAPGSSTLGPEGLDLIRQFQANPALSLRVSTPFRLPDGAPTVLMARPIIDPAGQFSGIVAAALNLRYFEEFYRSFDLGTDGVVVLHRRDGLVLSAYPSHDNADAVRFAGHIAPGDIPAQDGAGGLMTTRAGDGSQRLIAVRTLRGFPFLISLSLAADEVLAGWRTQISSAIVTGLVIAGTIGVLLLLIAGESRRVEALLRDNTRARAIAEAATIRITEQMEERERAETALRQAQRLEAVGQLTGGVAHDFNNLLTVLLGNIELMQATLPADSSPATIATRTRLERMRTAAERGATLTDQLLAFARRQPLVPRVANLNAVIQGMLELLGSAIGGKIEIDLALDPALWPVLVDMPQIELVILNLALNARDAMPDGGRLALSTANVTLRPGEAGPDLPAGAYVAVRVRDGGVGMTPEVAAHAFEPFYTTKDPSLGSGLGLSQVYGVARQSGGGALIESARGQGTTVTVLLPRASAAPEAEPRRDGAGFTLGARVLLVDDDDAVRTTTALILEAAGYIILQAGGAPAALEMINAGVPFDLLLTDVAMPVTNGAELADQVRVLRPAVPIVFISGYADPNAIAGRESLQPLVRKPFRVLDLTAEIEAALAGAKAASVRVG